MDGLVQSIGKDGMVLRPTFCKVQPWLTACNDLVDSLKHYPTKEDLARSFLEVFCVQHCLPRRSSD
jgi:hypothetical protein